VKQHAAFTDECLHASSQVCEDGEEVAFISMYPPSWYNRTNPYHLLAKNRSHFLVRYKHAGD
jgi:hypothetical protein